MKNIARTIVAVFKVFTRRTLFANLDLKPADAKSYTDERNATQGTMPQRTKAGIKKKESFIIREQIVLFS